MEETHHYKKNSRQGHDSLNQGNRIIQCPHAECNSYILDTQQAISEHDKQYHKEIKNSFTKSKNHYPVDNAHLTDEHYSVDNAHLTDDHYSVDNAHLTDDHYSVDNAHLTDEQIIDIRNINNLSDEEIIDIFLNHLTNERICDIFYMLQTIIQQKACIGGKHEPDLEEYFNNLCNELGLNHN